MTAADTIQNKTHSLWNVPLNSILTIEATAPDEGKPYFDEKVRELAERIKSHGFDISERLTCFILDSSEHIRNYEVSDGEASFAWDPLVHRKMLFIQKGHVQLAAARLAIKEGARIKHIPAMVCHEPWKSVDVMSFMARSCIAPGPCA